MGKVLTALTFLAAIMVILLCGPPRAPAMTEFLDGTLLVSGFVKETVYYQLQPWDRSDISNHRERIDFLYTSAFIEGLYKVHQSAGLDIQLYAGFRWWREKTELVSSRTRRDVNSFDRNHYNGPRSFEKDVLTEAYIMIDRGPLEVRIGKQILIWGQLDTNRVADVVNPLDLRWGVPGMDTWAEIKKGLWMVRALYTSSLPGNLVFEGIFNPGHYVPMHQAYVGSHWGPKAFKSRRAFTDGQEMGLWPWMYEKVYRDAPYFNTNNYEWGLRIQGTTNNFYWTLLYFNHLTDWGIASTRDGAIDRFAMQYVRAGIRSQITGDPLDPGPWPGYRVFNFKRYQTIGGTVTTYVPWLRQSTWDLEWFYEIDSPFNLGRGGSDRELYGETRKDVLGLALKYTDRLRLPMFLEKLVQTNKLIDFSITYFWEKIFGDSHDLIKADRNHLPGDTVADGISLWAKVEMFNTNFVLVPVGQYLFRTNRWYAVLPLTYYFPRPYENFRATMGFKFYGARRNNPLGNSWDRRDSLFFRFEYQF
jgi:hypothetical protein